MANHEFVYDEERDYWIIMNIEEIQNRISLQAGPLLIMGVGIPGSGKSTLLSELATKLSVVRINPDEIREELSGDAANQTINKQAWALANSRTKQTLVNGKSVVFDSTNTIKKHRAEAASKYRNFGALAVVAVVFDCPLDLALARNAGRDRVVPQHVLTRMYSNLLNEPVSLDEGFDDIIQISMR